MIFFGSRISAIQLGTLHNFDWTEVIEERRSKKPIQQAHSTDDAQPPKIVPIP